jgi:hypothetical protein
MNDNLTAVVVGAAGLVSFICFIVVLIQMFQHGATGMGILCIVLGFCCGLGGVIAFIYGWMKAGEWHIVNLMTVWTVAVAIGVVGGSINPAPFYSLRRMVIIQRD